MLLTRNRLRDFHAGGCGAENPFSFKRLARFYDFPPISPAAEAMRGIKQKQQNRK
jgi:hypothetical protein